jgi:hypothetical protein
LFALHFLGLPKVIVAFRYKFALELSVIANAGVGVALPSALQKGNDLVGKKAHAWCHQVITNGAAFPEGAGTDRYRQWPTL